MRAVRFDGTSVKMAEVQAPVPQAGEVLIKPLLASISSVDREVAGWKCKPVGPGGSGVITLGHNFVGTVIEAGPGSGSTGGAMQDRGKKLKGKRVVGAMNVSCGKCELCRGGLSNHCRTRTVVGAVGRDGCFAELLTLPVTSVYPVPDSVDNSAAVFANLIGAAAHASQMLRIEGKSYITVLGDGPLGLLTAQSLTPLNASVRLLGKHPEKFSLCERWGVKHRHVNEVGRRADQDAVIDCTGSPSGLELAMQLVRPRGKIILKSTATRLPLGEGAARTVAPGGIDLSPLVVNEIELLGCRCGSIDRALRLLEAREIDTTTLIGGRVKLDQVPGALAEWARASKGLKVIVEY